MIPTRVEYYIDTTITVGCGLTAGGVLVAEHPELEDPFIRALGVLFLVLLTLQGMWAARSSWLRMHGVNPVAVEFGYFDEDADSGGGG